MIVKASELRRNLFILLDRCLETGEPIEVERKAGALRIAPRHRRIPIDQLSSRPGVLVDAEGLDQFSPADWKP
jgi:hypothetical protein